MSFEFSVSTDHKFYKWHILLSHHLIEKIRDEKISGKTRCIILRETSIIQILY